MLRQILNLAWKELLQLRRDRFLILFLIIAPTLQLVLISRNTAQGLVALPVAVLNQDQSAISRELIAALDNTKEMSIEFHPRNREEMSALIDGGKAAVGIVIPPGFSRSFNAPETGSAQLQAIVDGTNILVGSNAEAVIAGVVGHVIKRHYEPPIPVDLGGVEVHTAPRFNPTFNFQWTAIPSTLAFITYQVALVIAATGFVREKELGTLEQLIITPLRRMELIIGKAIPAIIIGVLNFLLLMGVQTYIYHIPIRGSFGLLLSMAILFVIAIVGLGTVISVLTNSQQQAVLLVFLLAILEVTISGYLLPVENMPLFMRMLAQISALQHFSAIIRAIALRGADLSMIWKNAAALLAFTVTVTAIAWRTFTRTV